MFTKFISTTICFSLLIFNNVKIHEENLSKLPDLKRGELISKILTKVYFEANCYCVIGDDRGSQLSSYANPFKDFGSIKTYNGFNPDKQSNDDDCGRLCSERALQWLNNLNNDELCAYAKKTGTVKIVAYAHVGMKKWSVRQTLKTVNCCQDGSCPQGWDWNINAQKCAKALCRVASDIPGGAISLGNFGFVHGNTVYQMVPGSVTFKQCN